MRARVAADTIRQRLAPIRDFFMHSTPPAPPMLTSGIDAARSKCFPGAEVEKFIDRLTHDFLSLTDADSGEPLVDRLVRVDKVCDGAAMDVLPDLVIEWARARLVGSTQLGDGRGAVVRVRHPEFGIVEGANGYGRAGEHEPGGFFVAAGPEVRSGALTTAVSLFDFAPTICHALGCDLNKGDGKLIDMLLGNVRTTEDFSADRQ